MAWESRGKKEYYYRKVRVNGKVTSEYVGGDRDLTALSAEIAAIDAAVRKQLHEEWEAESKGLHTLVDAFLDEALPLLGLYKHKGQLRRKAVGTSEIEPRIRLRRIRELAGLRMRYDFNSDDLSNNPSSEDIALVVEAAAREVEAPIREMQKATIRLLCKVGTPAYGSAIRRRKRLRRSLGRPKMSAAERVLVEMAVLDDLQFAEYSLQQHIATQANMLKEAKIWGQRADRAQHSYSKTFETLIRIRKLLEEPPRKKQATRRKTAKQESKTTATTRMEQDSGSSANKKRRHVLLA